MGNATMFFFHLQNSLKCLMIYWCSCFGFISFLVLFNMHAVFQTLDYTTRLDHLQLQISLAGSSQVLFHNTWQININNSSRYLFFLLIEVLVSWPLEMGCCALINNRTESFGTGIIYYIPVQKFTPLQKSCPHLRRINVVSECQILVWVLQALIHWQFYRMSSALSLNSSICRFSHRL